MTKAAGILFVSMNGNALFLRRTALADDCPGCWDFPGGTRDGEEKPEETAIRECREEIGQIPDGKLVYHTRTISGSASSGAVGLGAPSVGSPVDGGAPAVLMPPDVDFTTFMMRVTNEFTPELNSEHDGFCWSPVDAPPEPLHPGCRIALTRLSMDELDVAEAIADGRLTSPQRYENVWLWALRLTGTGVSFRPSLNEYVHRDEEHHLTPRALARYSGLPVIMNHPKDRVLLNSEEFSKRIVGTIFLPYVAGDEAWGIAKVYDDAANRLMLDEDLSTSPGVNFRDYSVNRVLRLEDGTKVLKEGSPSLFDHVAICAVGVWDKGGDPSGIRSETREDSAMTSEEQAAADKAKKDAAEAEDKAKKDADEAAEKKAKEDAAKMDAEGGFKQIDDKLTHVLDALTGVAGRLDAVEAENKKRADSIKTDAEKEADEKAKKDADEADKKEKEDKAKKDADEAARKDSATKLDGVVGRINSVEELLKKTSSMVVPLSDDEHKMLADAWTRCDSVFSALGKATPRPMPGESSAQYRRRTALELQEFSAAWKGVDLKGKAFADDDGFTVVEGQILDHALAFAKSPAAAVAGNLREITTRSDSGHIVKEFVGQPRDWMDELAGQVQLRGEGTFLHQNLGRRAS